MSSMYFKTEATGAYLQCVKCFCPFRASVPLRPIPRALPWADCFCPSGASDMTNCYAPSRHKSPRGNALLCALTT